MEEDARIFGFFDLIASNIIYRRKCGVNLAKSGVERLQALEHFKQYAVTG